MRPLWQRTWKQLLLLWRHTATPLPARQGSAKSSQASSALSLTLPSPPAPVQPFVEKTRTASARGSVRMTPAIACPGALATSLEGVCLIQMGLSATQDIRQ